MYNVYVRSLPLEMWLTHHWKWKSRHYTSVKRKKLWKEYEKRIMALKTFFHILAIQSDNYATSLLPFRAEFILSCLMEREKSSMSLLPRYYSTDPQEKLQLVTYMCISIAKLWAPQSEGLSTFNCFRLGFPRSRSEIRISCRKIIKEYSWGTEGKKTELAKGTVWLQCSLDQGLSQPYEKLRSWDGPLGLDLQTNNFIWSATARGCDLGWGSSL